MTELTEKLMIKSYSPVLTQELSNIRNQSCIISLGDFIQILNTQSNKRIQRWHDNLLTTQVRDSLNNAIRINTKFYIVSFEIVDIFGNKLTTCQSFLINNFRLRIICSLNVIVNHSPW